MQRKKRSNRKRRQTQVKNRSFEKLNDRVMFAADLSIIDEGLQGGYFHDLQNELNTDIFSLEAPLVGDALADEIGSANDSSQFVASIGQQLEPVSLEGDVKIETVKTQISSALGVAKDDIQVIGRDGDSDIRFEVTLNQVRSYQAAVALNLVGADPEIELLLGNEDAVDVDLEWNYKLAFGVREDADGVSHFYFDTSAANELTVDYTATIRDDFNSGKGRVGVFVAELAANETASQFTGTYTIDVDEVNNDIDLSGSLTGSGTANVFIDASFFPSFLPEGSDGLVNLGVMADGVITYDTDVSFADGEVDAANNHVTVGFENVRLDLGRLYRDFVDPLIRDVQKNLKPIKPAIDFLTEPLPVISGLYEMAGRGEFTALTAAGYGPDHPVTKTVNVIDAILDYRGLTVGTNDDPLFSFEVKKSGVDPDTAKDRDEKIRENLDKLSRGELELELADKHKNPEEHAEWEKTMSWNAEFDGSFDLPFLRDFDTLAGFLLGDTSSEFFTFDIAAAFNIDFDVSVPIVPLMGLVQLNAGIGIGVTIDLDGGYDALGVDRLSSVADFSSEAALQQSLTDNQEYLVHGFYLDDHNSAAPGNVEGGRQDDPELTLDVTLRGGLSAGVDLKLLEFTFGGDVVLEGAVEFDLNDLPDPNIAVDVWPTPTTPIWSNYDTPNDWHYDGRFRTNEFTTIFDSDASSLFNVDGNIKAGLDATLEVSVLGFTVFDERWELFRTTIVDGSLSSPDDARIIRGVNPPRLGAVSNNGVLDLYMGSKANRRTNAEPNVVNESFVIQSLGESQGGGETLLVVFESTSGEKYARVFDGVRKIVASGGSGDDTISVLAGVTSPVELSGDAGNDVLSVTGETPAILRGGAGNDRLFGGSANDALYGGDGNDHLEGGSGDDMLDGGEGNDRMLGNAGNDQLFGRAGNDELEGGHDDDQLWGGADDDTLTGGVGSDNVHGEAGADTIRYEFFLKDAAGVDSISGGAHEDIVEIYGTEDADSFTISEVSPGQFLVANGPHATFQFSLPKARRDRDTEEIRISGLGGDDMIRAEGSFNVNRLHLAGGDGNDTLIGSDTRDLLSGGDGEDKLSGGGDDDELRGGDGADELLGGAGNDALHGESGSDIVNGETGADASYGGAGDDTIRSGAGFIGDLLEGGAGNDNLIGGPGIDTIRGQEGNDRIHGGGLDDALFGGEGNDVIEGGTGRDLVDGGSGEDQLYAFDSTTEPLTASNWNALLAEVNAAASLDDVTEELNDLTGHLTNSDGSQASVATQQQQLVDTLEARRGRSANEDAVIDSILVDLDATQATKVDRLLGGAGNDKLVGTRYNDVLHGGVGSDDVEGRGGDDQIQFELNPGSVGTIGDNSQVDHIVGGVNSDILEILGTEGNDMFVIRQVGGSIEITNGQQETFQFGSPNDQGFSELRISGLGGDDTIEAVGDFDIRLRLDGGDGNDLIVGGSADDWLSGGAGNDAIYGGGGDDEMDGGSGDDVLSGEAGDDTIVGGTGKDIVQGGDHNDELFALDSNVQLFARPAVKDDVTNGSTAISIGEKPSPPLFDGPGPLVPQGPRAPKAPGVSKPPQEDARASTLDRPNQTIRVDELDGGKGDDRLRGSDDVDRLRGGAGNDVIVHSLGEDVIAGGEGKLDRYTFLLTDESEYIDIFLDNPGDVLVSRSLSPVDRREHILGKANHLEIEVVGVEAHGGDDRIVVDFGKQAVMQLHADGGAGDDSFDLTNLPHDAVVWGGEGHDRITQAMQPGTTATNMVLTDTSLASDQHRELKDIESAVLSGNAGNNVMDARKFSGKVRMFGGAGNDELWAAYGNDALDGGAGDDLLGLQADVNFVFTDRTVNGAGADTYANFERAKVIGGSSSNRIDARQFQGNVEIHGGAGDDVLYGSLVGSDTIHGNDGRDHIFGEGGNDALYGGNHDDRLYGGNGNDHLDGGRNNDRVYGGDGHDTLHGQHGNDSLYGGNHNDTMYGGDGNDSMFGENGHDKLYGGNHNDHMNGGSGNDYLRGQNGHDTIYGGSGKDSLYGDAQNDKLYGESGNDYLDGNGGSDKLYGGSGYDRGRNYRWLTGWWPFRSWKYQDSLSSVESVSNVNI